MPNRKRTFADEHAEVSGSDSGDGSGSDAEETEADRQFINDEPLEEGEVSPCEKISRKERKIGADDIELVLENAGVRRPSRRVERSQWTSSVYKDSDEDCADSGDEGFVVSDSDEDTGRKATKLLREYTLSEGLYAVRVLALMLLMLIGDQDAARIHTERRFSCSASSCTDVIDAYRMEETECVMMGMLNPIYSIAY